VAAASPRRRIRANDVDLCLQTFGQQTAPPILLIAGACCSMDWWDDALCERLASAQRFVIRYDLRDTGDSVSSPAGAPSYGGADLVADAVGLLDALRVERAHVVGMSMGGGIAQVLALEHPGRVADTDLDDRRRPRPAADVSSREGLEPLHARLGDIAAPTLVVHGTDDPLFPYPHGETLGAEIPGARLLPLAGVGHEFPPPATWDELVPAIVEHTTFTHESAAPPRTPRR
jgi:pimeloyl-ACP methyl ester carboxylesterase